jgi:hypothetical protein
MKLELSDIESAYRGKVNRCMCGCSGEYFYARAVRDNDPDPKTAQKILNKLLKNIDHVKEEGDCVYFETPTMIYAVYLKPGA